LSHLRPEYRQRAEETVALYPEARSAMLPLLHLAQEQDGHVSAEAMVDVAELTGTTPAEVRGTATFFDMFHLEPVGAYVVGICTNVACLLAGGEELLDHAATSLGCAVGATSSDGLFTLEETECLADCNIAPCVQVNHRFVRTTSPEAFDELVADLRAGRRGDEIPKHGTLIRVRRNGGLRVPHSQLVAERAVAQTSREQRTPADPK
jgi:NADH-quinone oxidoreductase subunit E